MPIKQIPSAQWDRAREAFPTLLEEGSPLFLRLLAEISGCPWAIFWSFKNNVFEPAVCWEAPSPSPLRFDLRAEQPASGGPCGSVWRYAEPRWSRDAVADACMPRSSQADAAGLKMGIWFALGAMPKIAGVVELRARRLDRIDRKGMRLLERFGRGLPPRADGAERRVIPSENTSTEKIRK